MMRFDADDFISKFPALAKQYRLDRADATVIYLPKNSQERGVINLQNVPMVEVIVQDEVQCQLVVQVVGSLAQDALLRMHVACNAQVKINLLLLGSLGLTIELHMSGVGSSAQLQGAYVLSEHQSVQLTTKQYHHAAHTTSDVLIKGVLYDRVRADYLAMIHVDQAASDCDVVQKNKNLLLSEHARVVAEPNMQVLNDDVACSHGSATSSVDHEQIHYLCTRGLSFDRAQDLIVHGFLDDVIPGKVSDRQQA